MAKKQFKAESKRLLDLMINSIYTNREIFLRELISNASDAIDKLAYMALTDENVGLNQSDFSIILETDSETRTLTVKDNGIGMSKAEMEENLGTIAHSGSLRFKTEMEKQEGIDIIGQFGVGFYSAFMVAQKVSVVSKRYGSEEAFCWESSGADGYTITACEKDTVGTTIVLTLKEDMDEYLEEYTLKELVHKYSDFIRYPIVLGEETLNSRVPLWQKNKKDATQEEYDTFYKEQFMDFEAPLHTIHFGVEGAVTYKALLFIPAKTPYDFYTKEYKSGLKLYSSGVMITENCEDLLPEHFRFVKGVVDTLDLSLNISREMLQHTRELKMIASNLEKKIKSELMKMLETDREKYDKFYSAFGRQLKFGLVSAYGSKKELLQDLIMLRSEKEGKLVTLKEYREKMPESQKHIYYVSGENASNLPQTKAILNRGFDVICLQEQVDEFIPQTLQTYGEKEFRNILTDDLELETEEEKKQAEETKEDWKSCVDFMKEILGDKIADVQMIAQLGEHSVSMVPEGGMSFEMEKYFNAVNPGRGFRCGRILQLNPNHAAVVALRNYMEADRERAEKFAQLLYAQGLLIAGLPLEDPIAYSALVCELMN